MKQEKKNSRVRLILVMIVLLAALLGLLTAEAGERWLQLVPLGVDLLHVGDAAAVIGVVLAGQVAIHRGAFGDGAGAGVEPFIGFIGGSHFVGLLFCLVGLFAFDVCIISRLIAFVNKSTYSLYDCTM